MVPALWDVEHIAWAELCHEGVLASERGGEQRTVVGGMEEIVL